MFESYILHLCILKNELLTIKLFLKKWSVYHNKMDYDLSTLWIDLFYFQRDFSHICICVSFEIKNTTFD